MSIWNLEMKRVVGPSKFQVMVGSLSAGILLNGELEILSK
jgi:hypothetical protein